MQRIFSAAAFVVLLALATPGARGGLLIVIDYPTRVNTIPNPVEIGFGANDNVGGGAGWLFNATTSDFPYSAPPELRAGIVGQLQSTELGVKTFGVTIDGGSQSFLADYLFTLGGIPGEDPKKTGAIITQTVPQLGSGLQGYEIDDLTLEYSDWIPLAPSAFEGHFIVKFYGRAVPEPAGAGMAFVAIALWRRVSASRQRPG
jgi:hypothetical protein